MPLVSSNGIFTTFSVQLFNALQSCLVKAVGAVIVMTHVLNIRWSPVIRVTRRIPYRLPAEAYIYITLACGSLLQRNYFVTR